MSTPIQPSGMSPSTTSRRLRRVDLVDDQMIDRQHNLALAQFQQFAGHVELVGFQPGTADVPALGFQERVGHRAADQHLIDAAAAGF